MVPAVDCFEADGSLTAATITAAQNAGAALIAASGAEFVVWAKTFTKPASTLTLEQAKAFKQEQVGGSISPVQGYYVRDSAAQLRTRRT
jgi:hypothetical protein